MIYRASVLLRRREELAARWGVSLEVCDLVRELGLRNAFRYQRYRAIDRGIGWQLTFAQWLTIWVESGHVRERGPAAQQYVMSRRGDVGPYAVGNVFIQTKAENTREGIVRYHKSGGPTRKAQERYEEYLHGFVSEFNAQERRECLSEG